MQFFHTLKENYIFHYLNSARFIYSCKMESKLWIYHCKIVIWSLKSANMFLCAVLWKIVSWTLVSFRFSCDAACAVLKNGLILCSAFSKCSTKIHCNIVFQVPVIQGKPRNPGKCLMLKENQGKPGKLSKFFTIRGKLRNNSGKYDVFLHMLQIRQSLT